MQTVYTTTSKGAKITIFCCSEKTRYGFRHICEVCTGNINGIFGGFVENTAKISYYNRTWERYNFESVIHKALNGCRFSADKAENEKRIKRIKQTIDRKALPAWAR